MKRLTCLALAGIALGACGDDGKLTPDATPEPDAAPDANPYTPPTPIALQLAPTGPDQLQSAIAGPNGTFYAAGFAATTPAGPKAVVVVKLDGTGQKVAGFGTGGVATTTMISAAGSSGEIQLGLQPGGKIVVIATIAHAGNAADPDDRDIAVIRLDGTTGVLDTAFGDVGDNGTQIVDLDTSLGPVAAQRDASRGVAIGTDGSIYILGAARNPLVAATDSDFTVAKLSVDGVRDTAFGGGDGKFTLDIKRPADPMGSDATPRGIKVLPDGNLLAGGYANTPITSSTQPVLFKITPAGELVTAFAGVGYFHDIVVPAQTEVYNFAIHGDSVVTGGYGRVAATPTANDYISLRFNWTTGARDLAWGGTANGAVMFDPSGAMLGSNCRNAIAMPNGKTVLTGSTGPSNAAAQDAVFAVLDASGKLDTKFGTGAVKLALGSNGNDQFWGGAVSGTRVLVVGYKGGLAPPQTEAMNDDAYAIVFDVQ